MAEDSSEDKEPEKKKGGIGWIAIQLGLAFALGGAAFAAVWFLPARDAAECAPAQIAENGETLLPALSLEDTAFIEMEPLIISLGDNSSSRHLRIGITLEAASLDREQVAYAEPKLRDAFTGYLRAVEVSDLEDPNSMVRLRAQLQRRAQVIMGSNAVRNVLITDFVIR